MRHGWKTGISAALALAFGVVCFAPEAFAQMSAPLTPIPVPFPSPSLSPSMTPTLPSPIPIPPKGVEPSQPSTPAEEELSRLNQRISELYQAAKYGEAMPLAQQYVALAENLVGKDHTTYAAAIGSLSVLYRAQGRYIEAEPFATRALAIDEKELGPDHLSVCGDLENLAQLYQELERFSEAEPLYNRALDIVREKLGPEDPRVGNALNNLAWLYQAQGRYAAAEPLVTRALAIVEKAHGPEHSDVGRILDTLARLYEGLGRVQEAEPRYRRALAILEARLGTGNPEVAIVRGNFGGFYKSQGRLAEAEPLLKSALTAQEEVLDPTHPALTYSLTQLGDLYRLQGQCERAEPLFIRALAASKGEIEEVPVVFGTDRKRDNSQPSVSFGGDRNEGLSVGLAIVTVPKQHMKIPVAQLTDQSRSGIARAPTQKRGLAMRCTQIVNDTQLVETAVRRLGVSKTFPNQVFVFVHGYNLSFDNAVRRAAQIAYDMHFDGGTFLFSSPSRERLLDYLEENETVRLTADHLKEFLQRIVTETKAAKIHFIAHSMGNSVLLEALEIMARDPSAMPPVIGEIIHAAPDVDAEWFAKTVQKIKARGANITLYASSSDWALWASGKLRNRPRAGFISKESPLVVAGVDTIDISRAGTGLFSFNHDTYSGSPIIIADMRRIIARGKRPPHERTKEFEKVVPKEGGSYWRIQQPGATAR